MPLVVHIYILVFSLLRFFNPLTCFLFFSFFSAFTSITSQSLAYNRPSPLFFFLFRPKAMSHVQRKNSICLPSTDDEENRSRSPTASTATMITTAISTSSTQPTTDAVKKEPYAAQPRQQQQEQVREEQQILHDKETTVTAGQVQQPTIPSRMELMDVEAQPEGTQLEARRVVKEPVRFNPVLPPIWFSHPFKMQKKTKRHLYVLT